jgi:hypothetical protein
MTLLENEVVVLLWDIACEEGAGSQALGAAWEPKERAQRKTGADEGCHYAIPLGLVMHLG